MKKYLLLLMVSLVLNSFVKVKAEDETIDTYTELLEAIQNVSQDNTETVITISGNIDINPSLSETITLKENQNVVLVDDGSVASIKVLGNRSNRIFKVVENSKLTIKKSDTGYIEMSGEEYSDDQRSNKFSGVILVEGECVIDYVDMHDFSSRTFDSGVITVYGGSLTMNNGYIHNNNFYNQMNGIIHLTGGGKFVMNDGEISNNYLKPDELWTAAVTVEPRYGRCYFEMNGGKINNNTAFAGAVMVGSMHTDLFAYDWQNDMASMVMNGGTIDGNASIHMGGGVSVYGRGEFTMNDGTISNNTAVMGGGVGVFDFWKIYFEPYYPNMSVQDYEDLYNIPASFTMNGGNIIDNKAIEGGQDLIDSVGGCGGGVYAASNNVKLINGNITGNYAKTQGGGLYVAARPYETMIENAIVTENIAESIGGGIWSCPTGEVELFELSGNRVYGNVSLDGEDYFIEASIEGLQERKDKREIVDIDINSKPLILIKNNKSLKGGGIGTNGKVVITGYEPIVPETTLTPPTPPSTTVEPKVPETPTEEPKQPEVPETPIDEPKQPEVTKTTVEENPPISETPVVTNNPQEVSTYRFVMTGIE